MTTLTSAPARRSLIAARRVESEILDELPVDHPDAVHSRRDLRLTNKLMFQPVIAARAIRRVMTDAPRTMVDIGTGDGTFALAVARTMAKRWKNVRVILVDRQDGVGDEVIEGFRRLSWTAERVSADVFDFFAGRERHDLVTANLFLHHFPNEALAGLLRAIARSTSAAVATEPRRGPVPIASAQLLRLLGCNYVTIHDAVVSIRAGFRRAEIGELWPRDRGWRTMEGTGIPFSHWFAARRSGATA